MLVAQEVITMTRTGVLQEIRQMRFEELYERRRGGRLTQEEAAEILGVDVRTFRRWSLRYEAQGAEGLADRRLGKLSARRAPVDQVMQVLGLFATRYAGFTVKHFHEKLVELHGLKRSYTWVKNTLQHAGKVAKAKRRGAHRRKRARKPWVGMMLHQDGSRYEWVAGVLWDLIVTLDDATSEIYSAFLVEEEGTMSSFQGVQEVIETQGLFSSLYTDRGSHYWYTPAAGGKVDKTRPTQFHRALQQLGIELIAAYSPEARGRSERAFRTLQDRLPKELAVAGITDQESANRYLKEVFIPDHNRRFAVPAPEPGSALVPWVGGSLADILCVQEERTVANDNTVRYYNRVLQIPQDRYRCHYVKAKVRVHEYPNGTLAVFHGPCCLGRYDACGHLLAPAQVTAVQGSPSSAGRAHA
jgi:transposase